MKYLLVSLLLSCCLSVFSQDTLRALFLGNSYTAYNNLPTLTADLASAAGKTLIVDRVTPGGHTLQGHAANTNSLGKIRQGIWDYVILQEQSQIPTIDVYRYTSMYPGALQLRDSILYYNPCAKIVMYMTWGRRFGGQQCDQNRVNCSPDFVDFTHMQDSLASAYTEIADSIGAYIAPVGRAWQAALTDTALVLHTGDNSHPNYNGSYLAGCIFHAIFWKESPVGVPFYGSLADSLANYFQIIADSTVFRAATDWNTRLDSVYADFDFQTYGDSVAFTNLSSSLNPTTFEWDFGDGTTSVAENPGHRFGKDSSYSVRLITARCGIQDTSFQVVRVDLVGIDAPLNTVWANLYPNPTQDDVHIQLDQKTIQARVDILDPTGQLLLSLAHENTQDIHISLASFSRGMYFVRLTCADIRGTTVWKLLKE